MQPVDYLMESDEETRRLDLKTDTDTIKRQALWAGIKPGMRVADLGFGSGKTTHTLNTLLQPGGQVSSHFDHGVVRRVDQVTGESPDVREHLIALDQVNIG